MEDQVIEVKLRTRELNLAFFLWKGHKDEALGERGSLWCSKPRPRCSLLLPYLYGNG
jgi:hypothetical protein